MNELTSGFSPAFSLKTSLYGQKPFLTPSLVLKARFGQLFAIMPGNGFGKLVPPLNATFCVLKLTYIIHKLALQLLEVILPEFPRCWAVLRHAFFSSTFTTSLKLPQSKAASVEVLWCLKVPFTQG